MKDPSDALQAAVYASLMASTPLQSAMGGTRRVYDKVVPNPAYPFIRIGDDQVQGDPSACADGWEAFVTLHIFSQDAEAPRPEVKAIHNAILLALADDAALPAISGFKILLSELQQARTFMETDGVTAHGVVVIRYLIDDGA